MITLSAIEIAEIPYSMTDGQFRADYLTLPLSFPLISDFAVLCNLMVVRIIIPGGSFGCSRSGGWRATIRILETNIHNTIIRQYGLKEKGSAKKTYRRREKIP